MNWFLLCFFALSWISLDVVCWASLGVPYCSSLDIFSIALNSSLSARFRSSTARFFSKQLICYSALLQLASDLLPLASDLLQLRPAETKQTLEFFYFFKTCAEYLNIRFERNLDVQIVPLRVCENCHLALERGICLVAIRCQRWSTVLCRPVWFDEFRCDQDLRSVSGICCESGLQRYVVLIRISIDTSLETGVVGFEEREVVAVFVCLRDCGPVACMFFNSFG
ncbi:hypothetical protein F511_07845 [Dorcoceras hygrometricum]|uniref:Secreted protein n=1 Tax=Dorcoceras hygrometricum TaxID=472368 RepID=A0A2Z7AYQ4_9LAMI|nr:hypothetical protein F511_07845 [Dorcoceras hygrometricum]